MNFRISPTRPRQIRSQIDYDCWYYFTDGRNKLEVKLSRKLDKEVSIPMEEYYNMVLEDYKRRGLTLSTRIPYIIEELSLTNPT